MPHPAVRFRSALALSLLAALASPAPAAEVRTDPADLQVGFPYGFSQRAVREGQWFPIQLALQLQGAEFLAVELHVECTDLEGDFVTYIADDLVLSANAGLQRFWCYAAASRSRSTLGAGPVLDAPNRVAIVDADSGAVLTSLDFEPPEVVDADSFLILDISRRPLASLRTLESTTADTTGPAWGERRYYRKTFYGARQAADLPDAWFGLEPINAIVWNEPQFETGVDQRAIGGTQLNALKRWVASGGSLVVGLGPNADAIANSPLAEILPVTFDGGVTPLVDLPTWRTRYARNASSVNFTSLEAANLRLKPGATRLVTEQWDGRLRPLVARGQYGAGEVTVVATSLRQLLRPEFGDAFPEDLLNLPRNPDTFRQQEAGATQFLMLERPAVADPLLSRIDFAGIGRLFVLFVTFFVGAYVAAATLVSFFWLKSRRQATWAWPVFGLIAVAVSLLSWGTVRASRGLADQLHSVAIIDLDASATHGRGWAWFGYRSTNRQTPDFTLRGTSDDPLRPPLTYLRPRTPGRRTSTYPTPARYTVYPDEARIEDVPLRATLKQFEGRWEGDVGGAIRGRLIVDRRSGQVTPSSWVANDLPADLVGGVLLYLDPRAPGDLPATVSELRQASYRHEKLGATPPPFNVLAVPLPALARGTRTQQRLGAGIYQRVAQDFVRWQRATNPREYQRPDLPTLLDLQNDDWAGANSFAAAAFLASTVDFYLHAELSRDNRFDDLGTPVQLIGLPELDISHWLRPGQAVLLYVSEAPAPLTLERNGAPIAASRGNVLYRVRLPVEYVGTPPRLEEFGQ